MVFDVRSETLFTDGGEFIKKLSCPLKIRWENLTQVGESDVRRYCENCEKNILNTSGMSDAQVQAVIMYDPDACLYIDEKAGNVRIVSQDNGLRHVYTAFTVEEMNRAAHEGFWPLVKKVEYSGKVAEKIQVRQNPKTGEVFLIGDYRAGELNSVIPFFYYTPQVFPRPIAAYLVPADIRGGERVRIVTLIEEFVGASWNQGDTYRQRSAEAVWNGKEFEIDYQDEEAGEFVG
ncbi:MAG: hypothetical protein P8Z41_16215 [Anaerolineales bacterium]|jgi:hypothetical protein